MNDNNNQIPFMPSPGPNNSSILMILLFVVVVVGGSIGLAMWIGDVVKFGAVVGVMVLVGTVVALFVRFLQHKDFSSGADARGQVDTANTNMVIGLLNTVLPLIGNQGNDQAKQLREYNDSLARTADSLRELMAAKDQQHTEQIAELRKMLQVALPAPSGQSIPREVLQPVEVEDEVVPARPIGQRIEPSVPHRMPDEWEYRFKKGNGTARGDIMHAIVYWFDENEKPGSPFLDRRTAVRKMSGLTFKNTEYTDALQALVDAGLIEGVGAGAHLVQQREVAIHKLAEIRVEQFQRWGVLK